MTELEKSILGVVVYFDLFDYPVTLLEIRNQKLEIRFSVFEIRRCLDGLRDKIEEYNGFYFLRPPYAKASGDKGRKSIVETRMRRYNIAERKYKKVLWVGRILSWLPHVRMLGICNTLGYSNARDESDIDLFIVTKIGRVWCCRFFVLLVLKLLGLRPKQGDTRDKICASFFVTEDNMDLEKIRIEDDVYLRYWLEQVVVIFDQGGFYERFREVNKLGGGGIAVVRRRKHKSTKTQKHMKRICERLFLDVDERFYKWLQMKIMPGKLKKLAREDNTDVVINDGMLKFHDNDRRRFYRDEFYRRLAEVGDL